ADAAALARPFAVLAGGSFLVVALTGLYAAGLEVTSIDGLLTTLYGKTLLAKTAVVGVVGALGGANFVLLRSRNPPATRATIAAEAGAGALVLLAAGILTASVPARGPQFAAPRPVHAPTLVHQADDLLLTVNVTPNRPGTNTFKVQAISVLRPPP